jgi:hypothetical protein
MLVKIEADMKISDVLNYFPEEIHLNSSPKIQYSDKTFRVLKAVSEALKNHQADCDVAKDSLTLARFEYLFWKDAKTQQTDRNKLPINGTQNASAKTVCLKVLEALENHRSRQEINQIIDGLPTNRGAPKAAAKSVLDIVLTAMPSPKEASKFHSKLFSMKEQEELMKILESRIAGEKVMFLTKVSEADVEIIQPFQIIYNMLFNGIDEDVGVFMEEMYSVQWINPGNPKDKVFLQKFTEAYKMHNGTYRVDNNPPQAMREVTFYILGRRYQIINSI